VGVDAFSSVGTRYLSHATGITLLSFLLLSLFLYVLRFHEYLFHCAMGEEEVGETPGQCG